MKTPIGTLNLLADDQILIGANLSTISAFNVNQDLKVVKSIPVISDLISDYFNGNLCAKSVQGKLFRTQIWRKIRVQLQQFVRLEVLVQITQ